MQNIKAELKSLKRELLGVKIFAFWILSPIPQFVADGRGYHDNMNSPFLSIYYLCGLPIMIWIQNVNYEYIHWTNKYGDYFDPQIFPLHNFLLLYILGSRVCIGFWYLCELIACLLYLANDVSGLSDWQLGCVIFVIIRDVFLVLCYGCCIKERFEDD